mgnify:CR=1 FL=1
MLNEQTLTQLKSLRLDGMVRAIEEQATSTAADTLGFDDRLTLLVQREIYEEVVEAVVKLAEGLSVGLGQDNPDLTPVVSAGQLASIETLCRRAVDEGAVLATGGEAHSELAGHFMRPTVFRDVTAQMCIAQEEVFGPVLAILPFDTEEEAIAIANGTEFGLVAGVFTHEFGHAVNLSHAQVNGPMVYSSYTFRPFYPGVPQCVAPVHYWNHWDDVGVNRADPAIVETMENAASPAVHLTVPIKVDVHAAGDWDGAH